MDIILCRNVLMYFTPDVARRVIEGFHRCLLDGGWLIVSPGEANPDLFPGFERVAWPDVVLFRRLPAEAAVPAAPPAWQPAGVPEELEAACDDLATVILPPAHPFDRALALYQQGRYGEAEELLKTVDEPRASMLLAKVYANRGELAEALSWCEKALAHDRLSPACHYLRGSILQELGRIGDAVDALKRTLYLDQSFVPAYVALGRLSQRQGQRQEAERYFRSALATLRTYPRDQSLPELDGMTAGRLAEAIQAAQSGSRA
jgi:chemotaxis protein methyltransferase CheR